MKFKANEFQVLQMTYPKRFVFQDNSCRLKFTLSLLLIVRSSTTFEASK